MRWLKSNKLIWFTKDPVEFSIYEVGITSYMIFTRYLARLYFAVLIIDKNQTYIGRTKRHLATWLRVHLSGNSAIF